MHADHDLVVVGGGVIGCAIAWGATRAGAQVAVVDGADGDYRASVGNFGLLWTQGKGIDAPAYAEWTRSAIHAWPGFAQALEAASGIDVNLETTGGLHFLLSEAEAEKRMALLAPPGARRDDFAVEFIGAAQLRESIPRLGPEVFGATYCRRDGAVDPLALLRALHAALAAGGATILPGHPVAAIRPGRPGFHVEAGGLTLRAPRLVLAAGLGSRNLGRAVGLDLALFPQRGQLLVTARTRPFLHMPASSIRQMREGTVLLGSTQENVGFDKTVGTDQIRQIARRALRIFPLLAGLDLVRSWACLRVMTPDGLPIYQQSRSHPGAFAVTAHSGITLAGLHATTIAPAILAGSLPAEVAPFAAGRFGDWSEHAGGSEH